LLKNYVKAYLHHLCSNLRRNSALAPHQAQVDSVRAAFNNHVQVASAVHKTDTFVMKTTKFFFLTDVAEKGNNYLNFQYIQYLVQFFIFNG
jgi:hypothetical protein